MSAHRPLRVVLALLMGALTIYAAQPSAGAAAPEAQAWWYLARSSEIPIATPVPPTVDDDGLYVAAGPNGAIAVAALRAPLGDVAGATITLELTDTSGVVTIGACRTAPWFPVQAGNWDERPKPDCDAGAAEGAVSDDETSVTFDVTALVENGTVDVVIIPGEGEGGAPANFTASIAPPGDGTIATQTASPAPAAPPSTGAAPGPDAAPAEPSFTPPPIGSSSFRPAGGVSAPPAPQEGIEIPPQATEVAAPATRPRPRPSASTTPTTDAGRLLAVGIIAAVAVAFIVLRGRDGPLPGPLMRFGTPAIEGSTTVTSGIGRFERERIGRAPPLA